MIGNDTGFHPSHGCIKSLYIDKLTVFLNSTQSKSFFLLRTEALTLYIGFTVYMSSAMKYISIFHKSAIFFLRYLAEVPDFFEMEEYIEDVMKRKNCLLIERRVVEKSLLGKEAIIVWIVKKLEEK